MGNNHIQSTHLQPIGMKLIVAVSYVLESDLSSHTIQQLPTRPRSDNQEFHA